MVKMSERESGEKIRLFLADDQAIVRQGLTLLLNEQNTFEIVGEAANGRDAVEGVQRLQPDIALMDIEMPVMSGIEAARRISQTVPETSVIMLTVDESEEYLTEALRAGAAGYVLKGADLEELTHAIMTVYAGDKFIYPSMATKMVINYLQTDKPEGESDDVYHTLSQREKQVLPLIADNYTPQQIADMLGISRYTVQTYRQRVMKKLGIHSKAELIRYALRRGLIELE